MNTANLGFRRLILALLGGLVALSSTASGGDFAGLRPGRSTLSDAERKLGKPLDAGPPARFPGMAYAATDISVFADAGSGVIRTITIHPIDPPTREQAIGWFRLGEPSWRERRKDVEVEAWPPQGMWLLLRDGRVVEIVHFDLAAARDMLDHEMRRSLRVGDRDGLRARLRSLCAIAPSDPEPRLLLADALYADGDNLEALALASEALALSPQDPAAQVLHTLILATVEIESPGWIGVHLGGTTVTTVFEGTPASEAGIQEGDEIVEVDRRPVEATRPPFPGFALTARGRLLELLDGLRVGRPAEITVSRSGQVQRFRLTPIDRGAYFARRKRPESELEAGMILAVRGFPGLACSHLRKALDHSPDDRTRYELAQACAAVDLKEGLKAWREFLAGAGPLTPAAWLSQARDEVRRLTDGVEAFHRGMEAYGVADLPSAARAFWEVGAVDNGELPYWLGQSLLDQARVTDAAACLRASARLFPDGLFQWKGLSEALGTYDLPRAHAACVRILRVRGEVEGAPGSAERDVIGSRKNRIAAALAAQTLGERLLAMGAVDDALAELEEAARLCPRSATIAWSRVRALNALGRTSEALSVGREALKVGDTPVTGQICEYLGIAEEELDQLALAVAHLEKAVALMPGVKSIEDDLASARQSLEWQRGFEGGFENRVDGPWTQWTTSGGCDIQLTYDDEAPMSGDTSLRVENRSPRRPNVFATVARGMDLDPGQTHRVQVWARAEGLASDGGLSISVDPEWKVRPIALPKGTYGWTLFEGTFRAGTGDWEFRIISEDVGRVWLDDLRIFETGGAR